MERCVIIGGAPISNYERAKEALQPGDHVIYCDCGLRHMPLLGLEPGLIVGDFDSHPRPDLPAETICLPREKDDTDTFFAAKEALRRGYRDFLLLGVFGGRLDHTLANVSILLYLHSRGCRAVARDDHSEMEIVGSVPVCVPDTFAYFSVLNITGDVRGIEISGAKYPLSDGEIECEYQYGVSNEPLPGCTAKISAREGRLLLIKDFDR